MADFTLEALKDEIVNDPEAKGYKNSATPDDWKDDQVIADLINEKDTTLSHDDVDTGQIRGSISFDAFDGLNTAEQAWFEWLTANGVIPVTADTLQQLAGIPTANDAIWAVAERTEANAAMAALMQYTGSRAEELWGEGTGVSAGSVGAAFNLI